MACPYDSERSFGPRVDPDCRSFDFTLQFEDLIFACVPDALFIVLSLVKIATTVSKPSVNSAVSKLLASKIVALAGLFVTRLTFLALRARNRTVATDASLAADVLSCAAVATAIVLCCVDHLRSSRPSTVLSLYLSASTLLGIARVRTLWLLVPGGGESIAGTVALAFTATAALLDLIGRKAAPNAPGAPEAYSGIWNRTGFVWLWGTFRTGHAKVMSADDLPVMDAKLKSSTLHRKLVSTWARYDHRPRHSLLRACFHSYSLSFLSAVIPRLCLTAFTFAQPFLINTTVTFVGQPAQQEEYGKGLIGAWVLVYLGIAASNSMYLYQHFRFIARMRGGLIALVYERTLQTRAADLGDITAVTLMGTDVQRIASGLQFFHEVWGSLLDITIASWLLGEQLSLACLAPIVLVIVFVAITSRVSLAAKSAQRRWVEKVEKRLQATSAFLGDMKAVKMLGLSQVMSRTIGALRKSEIDTSKSYRRLFVTTVLLSITPMNLAPVITFAVYVIISVYWKNESLFTAQAFTSIALIALLTSPVVRFVQGLPMVIQCIGSFDRIQEYCNYGLKGDDQVSSVAENDTEPGVGSQIPAGTCSGAVKPAIVLEGQSFGWNQKGPAVLKELEIQVEPGQVTAIVGQVGSGKSALLNGLLGEMSLIPPALTKGVSPPTRLGPVAYCSQQPWLQNDTIRQNIVGTAAYDRAWYNSVMTACDLEKDMDQLRKGDLTPVGSKGLTLSGGQRQRIALARAVYAQRGTIFLDDVFSGMDARTAKRVSHRLIGKGGLLRRRQATVVMATHSREIMALADSVLVLEDGRVVESGRPEDLARHEEHVNKLGVTSLPLDEHEPQEAAEKSKESEDEEVSRPENDSSAEEGEKSDQPSTDERRKKGDLAVYKYYIAASGHASVAFFVGSMILWTFCTEFSTVWVKWWAGANAEEPNKDVGMYMGVYAAIGILGTVSACVTAWFGFVTIISNSALQLHSDLLETTLRAPFRFFAATDAGSLLNRFSQDLELVDMDLPSAMINCTSAVFSCLGQVIVLAVFSQYLGVAIPVFGIAVYVLQRFYLQTSRQVRLLGIEAQAPLYTHVTESVAGATTIRAFGWQADYLESHYGRIDASQRPEYMQSCIQRWLKFVLDCIVAALAAILVTTVVVWKDKFSAGSVGVSLVMVVGFSETLARLIQAWTRLESSVGAVARVRQFVCETEREEGPEGSAQVPQDWPQAGTIEFDGVVASYRPDADPVLRGVSMSVKHGQHLAICGRSGSGKSSLVMCLLKLMNLRQGQIRIDGVDISALPSEHLRERINVVSQDPFLFPGTIRSNIDVSGSNSDAKLIQALERVGLWSLLEAQGGLDKQMDAAAWSAGQKQLFCFARAMVKKSPILILDEATSNLDGETASVIQRIVGSEFSESTVVAITHQLRHISSYDSVAVMGDGAVLEFGEPEALLTGGGEVAKLYRA